MRLKGIIVGIYSFVSLLLWIVLMSIFRNKIPVLRKIWAYSMIKVIGIKIKEIGTLDKNADIIALNHNSMLDIILFDYLHPKDIAWVTNKKLSKVFLFGLIFKLPKLILIDPLKKSSLKILLNESKIEHSKNRPIGIFPEGTREENDEIKNFEVGTRILSEKLNLTVQPIILIHTRERLDTKAFTSSSGEVKIVYLETIKYLDKEGYKKMEELMLEKLSEYQK